MTPSLLEDLHQYISLISEENVALETGQIACATAMLPIKQALSERITSALADLAPSDSASFGKTDLFRELFTLTARNEELLMIAMTQQKHIVDLLIDATNRSTASSLYGRHGNYHAPSSALEQSSYRHV